MDEKAVQNFQKYLQIPSVHPDVDYEPCVEFLTAQAEELDLPMRVYRLFPKHPIIIITWEGQDPKLPAILLNSHMDVVPVFEESWTYDPFGGEIDDKGNIYGRGAQDMKCVGIQYLEAVRRLRQQDVKLRRTVLICFVPDEETGGYKGMRAFAKTEDFKALNIGCTLDEGMPSDTETFRLFYGERCIWQMYFRCPGQTGHGSLLLENTPGEKVRYILDKLFQFRDQEKQKLVDNPSFTTGDVTTVNLTQLQGGKQTNVVPPELVAVVDCRIPVTLDVVEFEKTINQWCKDAGPGAFIEYELKQPQVACTKCDDSNPYWLSFKKAADELKINLSLEVFPGGTDSRYIRGEGIPALGFSPINNTPTVLHDNDECLNKDVFLRGIEIYCKLITTIANT